MFVAAELYAMYVMSAPYCRILGPVGLNYKIEHL